MTIKEKATAFALATIGKVAGTKGNTMPEIEAELVKKRLAPIRNSVREFINWCDTVQYVAEVGYDVRSVARSEAEKLRKALDVFKQTL